MHMLPCMSVLCHLQVAYHCPRVSWRNTNSLPRLYSSSLIFNVFLSILFRHSQLLLPPGCVSARRVSTVTGWIWSTVNVSSHSSWIIKQHFFCCCSHVWCSKSGHEYSVDWFWWLVGNCMRNHYFITKKTVSVDWGMAKKKKKRGRWFLNI